MPCHPQSALAGLNARPRVTAFGVSTSRAALTARSRAMRVREPGQIRKEAALSGSGHVPRIGLARVSHDASARGPFSRTGRTVLPILCGEAAGAILAIRRRILAASLRGGARRRRLPPSQPAGGPGRRGELGGPAPSAAVFGGGAPVGRGGGGGCGPAPRAPSRVDDPSRVPRLARRVHPGEVEVVAAAVAGVAVPADPPPGRDRMVLRWARRGVRGRRSRPRCRPRLGWARCRSPGRSGARHFRRGRGRSSIRR